MIYRTFELCYTFSPSLNFAALVKVTNANTTTKTMVAMFDSRHVTKGSDFLVKFLKYFCGLTIMEKMECAFQRIQSGFQVYLVIA